MASISSPGLGSGLDVNGIITKLMQVESQPLTNLQKQEVSYQAKLTAFGTLQGALSSLQTAAQTLKSSSTFTGKTATVSDATVLAAAASSTAATGNYSVTVTQLAKYHAVRSNTNYAATTDTFTTGSLFISIGGGTEVEVAIDGTNNTLSGIRQAINDANAGVTASIINDGTSNRLVLSSKTSGSAGAIGVRVVDTAAGGTNALGGLDTTSGTMVTAQPADDALLTVNGLSLTRSSNTISDAVEGLTLSLTKGTPESPATTNITVKANTESVTTAIDAFVKAYNDVVGQIKSLTAYDAANNKASVLTGDGTARSIQTQLMKTVRATVSGIAGGVTNLSDIGISVQKDGKLSINSSKLSTALNDPDTDIASLFGQTVSGNEGIAVRFYSLMNSLIGVDGLLSSRTDGIQSSIDAVQKRSDAMNVRLAQIEKRYRAQFTALDTLISSMQQTQQYLTQQLANLPSTSSN